MNHGTNRTSYLPANYLEVSIIEKHLCVSLTLHGARTKMMIADASVLIALAKMRRLDLLRLVYGDALIGPQVKAETVDAGKRISAPGVERIERALDDGWLQVARLSSKEKNTAHSIVSKGGLGAGRPSPSPRRAPVD